MKTLKATIPIGLGDLIFIKSQLESAIDRFDEIHIKYHYELIDSYRNGSPGYDLFLKEMGELLFSDKKYILNQGNDSYDFGGPVPISDNNGIAYVKPNLKHLLCKGSSLNCGPYIVLTTKIRSLSHSHLMMVLPELWDLVKDLSRKYKIVVLGERSVEMNQEYKIHTSEMVYGIYDQIINNIPKESLIDLTIPALGVTSPTLSKVQQDCLIMSEADLVITLGVGGNFCMAIATSNVIGYRTDEELIVDRVFDKFYDDAKITKNWNQFIELLKNYR